MTRKERYDLYKSQQRCGSCGKQDERTLVGKAVCKTCADRMSATTMKRYNRLSNSGLCVACGEAPAVIGKMCKFCRNKEKILGIRRSMKRGCKVIQA